MGKYLKIIAPTWNDKLELPEGSYSVLDLQGYIECFIKKYETLPTNSLFHIYIYRMHKKLVSEIKGGYKLELQTPETMKLFGSTKKLI